jgi:hypothetical protein
MNSVQLEVFEKELNRLIEQAAEAGIDGRSVADILRRAATTLDPPGLLSRAEMDSAIEAAKAEGELKVGDDFKWKGRARKVTHIHGVSLVLDGVDDMICVPVDATTIRLFVDGRATAKLDPPGAIEAAGTEADDDYFGLCPICHKTDGYANAGRFHRFFCKEHKTSWGAGSNLFSDWRDQTEEEQHRIWDEIGLDDFQDVEPWRHPRQHQDDVSPHFVRDEDDALPF